MTDKVIDLTEERLDRSNWRAGTIICEYCLHSWVASFPEELTELECPNCSAMTTYFEDWDDYVIRIARYIRRREDERDKERS
jgi:hypothetical protein